MAETNHGKLETVKFRCAVIHWQRTIAKKI